MNEFQAALLLLNAQKSAKRVFLWFKENWSIILKIYIYKLDV
jgi:hypothetical protein